ncbi:MAG: FixH family protein [Hyphomicrobiaceae bacterium]
MPIHRLLVAAALLAGTAAPALAADRAKATLDCKALPSPEFAYDCTLDLANARTGAPVEGATIILGADMPSMPMVHNVPPFEFKPAGQPGRYQARIQLDMYGPWAIKLRITGPLRDEVVAVYQFGSDGSELRKRGSAGKPERPPAAKPGQHRH